MFFASSSMRLASLSNLSLSPESASTGKISEFGHPSDLNCNQPFSVRLMLPMISCSQAPLLQEQESTMELETVPEEAVRRMHLNWQRHCVRALSTSLWQWSWWPTMRSLLSNALPLPWAPSMNLLSSRWKSSWRSGDIFLQWCTRLFEMLSHRLWA